MAVLRFKGVEITNYKGISSLKAELFQNTEISGQNGVGKSTVKDSAFDILTDRMADGTSTDNIRPKVNGVDVDHVEVKREVEIELDGEEHTLTKITKQNWVKPRGCTEEILKGNVTTYQIDGYDKKSKEFNEFLDSIADAETRAMCMNPIAFINRMRKSTVDARQLLERISKFSLEDFVKEHPQFQVAYDELKGHSIEEYIKQKNKDLRLQNKSRDDARTRLQYEKERYIDSDCSKYEESIAEYNEKLSDIDKELSEINEMVFRKHQLQTQMLELEFDLNNLEREANKGLIDTKKEISSELDKLKEEQFRLNSESASIDGKKNMIKIKIDGLKKDIYAASAELKAVQGETFDESKTNCPTCGRKLTEKQILSIKKSFDEKKKANIEFITKKGKSLNSEIKKLQKEYDAIVPIDIRRINELHERIKAVQERYDALPESVDMSQNTDYISKKKAISDLKAEIDKISELSVKGADLTQKAEAYRSGIRYNETQINTIKAMIEDHEKRVADLEENLRDEVQRCADIEMKIDMIKEFAFAKNQSLSEAVNQNFKFIKFQFVDTTLEGNVFETLRIVVDGIDYMNGLNESSKKLAEVDLCCGLQTMNDLVLPIWLDEASIIDEDRIPWNIPQQLICIRRTDDKTLTVKEIKND